MGRLWLERGFWVLVAMTLLSGCVSPARFVTFGSGPYQATGLKIGEVTSTSAVVWTRGTLKDKRGLEEEEFDFWIEEETWNQSFLPGDLSDASPAPVEEQDQRSGLEKFVKVPVKVVKAPVSVGGTAGRVLVNHGPVNPRAVLRVGSVPGKSGQVEIVYQPADGSGPVLTTKRLKLRRFEDYIRQVRLEGLRPGTQYDIESRLYRAPGDTEPVSKMTASFRTAPSPETSRPVTFTVVTGQARRTADDFSPTIRTDGDVSEIEALEESVRGHKIYPQMLKLDPDFMVHTGDVVYYDHQGSTARSKRAAKIWWQRMFSLPNMVAFHRKVPVYYMKDDHDTLKNDCWPGQRQRWLSYREGRHLFHMETPLSLEKNLSINDGKPYRTVRWGRDCQIWMTEVRDYRDPNTKNYDDPKKSMLGEKQFKWLEETLAASDATFRIVICQGPIVGPDRPEEPDEEEKERLINRFRPPRIDNLANPAWKLERARLLELFDQYDNVILLVGDRHWKYHSVWPSKADPRLHEISCGSVSDEHARSGLRMIGVPTPDEDEMLVWRDEVEQGGFVSVEVGPGAVTARFHKVDGSMAYPVNRAGRREVVIRPNGSATFAR